MLTAVKQTAELELYFCCGCFRGSETDIREFIEAGEERYKASRTLAVETAKKLIAVERSHA
jgi:hypothetical protein